MACTKGENPDRLYAWASIFINGLEFSWAGCPKNAIVSSSYGAAMYWYLYWAFIEKKEDLHLSKKHVFYAFVSAGIFIGTAYGLTFILKRLYELDFQTGFLSIVPGGLDQMGIIAASVHANVTIVTAFQLFRLLIVSIFLVPFVKVFVKKSENLKRTGCLFQRYSLTRMWTT